MIRKNEIVNRESRGLTTLDFLAQPEKMKMGFVENQSRLPCPEFIRKKAGLKIALPSLYKYLPVLYYRGFMGVLYTPCRIIIPIRVKQENRKREEKKNEE